MKLTSIFFAAFAFLSCASTPPAPADLPKTIYEYQVEGLEGGTINFADFKGKKILIVNTASKCGYTGQYEGLEKLYKSHKDKLVIIGFPSNDFAGQEPGKNEDIAAFCQKNYGVTFPMAAKIAVKGDSIAPIYHWLTTKEYNGHSNSTVKWNFQKYLINEQGQLVQVFSPDTKPESPEVLAAIES